MSLPGSGAGSWLSVSTTKTGQAAWATASAGSYSSFPMHPGGLEFKSDVAFSGQARGGDLVHGRGTQVIADGSEIFDVYPHNLDYFLQNRFNVAQTNPAGSIYEHTYTVPQRLELPQPYGMTVREGLGTAATLDTTKEFVSAFCTSYQFAIQNNFLVATIAMMAANRTFTTKTPSFGTQTPFTIFGKMTVDLVLADASTYDDVPVRNLSINIPCPGRMDYSDTAAVAKKFSATDRFAPEISWNWDFATGEPEPKLRTAWENKQQIQCTITLEGAELGTSQPETVIFYFPYLIRGGADPKVSGPGAIQSPWNFKAQRDITNGIGAVRIFTRNGNNLT